MKKIGIGMLVLAVFLNAAATTLIRQTNPIPLYNNQKQSINAPVVQSDVVPCIDQESHGMFIPVVYGNAGKITFSNGISFDTEVLGKAGEPNLPGEMQYRPDESAYYIVQFKGPVYEAQKSWLNSNGVVIHFYIPHYGFVCSIEDMNDVEKVRAALSVAWVGMYQPAYKVSGLFEHVGNEHRVTILMFMDADITAVLAEVEVITGRAQFEITDNGINKMIHGMVSQEHVNTLARIPGIYWIEPYIQPVQHNVNVQWIVQDAQSGVRNIWDKGIRGEGEIVNNTDSGINTSHYMHRSGSAAIGNWGYYPSHNAIVAYDSGAASDIIFGDGGSYHGTHTVGTLTGDDSPHATSNRDGIAMKAKVYFNDCGDNTSGSIYTYGDLNDLYIRSYNRYYPPTRAHTSSNSWGAAVAGEYTSTSLAVDQFMWGQKDFLLCFSAGNSGPSSGSIGAPASAKNVVTVGGCLNGSANQYQSIYFWGSRGPCPDGRMKPTIITPAQAVWSAYTGTSNYQSMSGTSMASPSAAGAAALVRQYLREGWYPTGSQTASDSFAFISAALLKAILVNCADDDISGYQVPDNNIGWGRVDLDSTLYFTGEARKTLLVDNTPGVLTGEQVDYHFNVPSGAANLKIALVWTDYPGNPAVLTQIVNDLDLVVTIGGTYYNGNQYSGGESQVNPAGRDSLNVVECVRRNSPLSGDYRVSILARNVPCGPQPFSLVISYNAGSVAGVVTVDKPVYRANDFVVDTVRIRVEDTNYGAPGSVDQVMVVINSAITETQPETLYCTELAANAYVFTGEMPLLFHKPVHGDDKLSVCQGDTIHVAYTDANPSYTSITWAGVDASYFVISDVHGENIEADMVDIVWLTNENSSSTVYYGIDPGNLNQVVSLDTPYVNTHRVHITGLSETTRYYYDVESRDFRGNVVRDNNGGQHYSFSTGSFAGVDILVALADGIDGGAASGQPLPGLQSRFRKAIESGGWSYTWWRSSDHGGEIPARDMMKNYKAVFVPCEDEYPPYLRAQQETIKVYQQNGGRIAFAGHDFLWFAWDYSTTPGYDSLWCKNYLQGRYVSDITPVGNYDIYGVAGDPISGDYTGGVFYSPHRDGACGDEMQGISDPPNGWDTGTSTNIWRWNAINGMLVGTKWESNNTHGTLGDGVWGGHRTRTVMNAFSATQMDTLLLPDILNKIFIWLIGHDHPDVTISSPQGGQTYSSSPISVAWTASAYGGASVDTTWIEYSPDQGQTWIALISGTGVTSPYSWDISSLTNGLHYRVRVTVCDKDVYPSMKGFDETGNFTISIPGNDYIGPKVIPQSMTVQYNPMIVTATNVLLPIAAAVNDSLSGLSNIAAAEWSLGSNPASPGSGTAMAALDGSFNQIQEGVTDTIYCTHNPGVTNVCTLWVRGQDAATNWGSALMRTFTIIDGQIIIGVSESGKLIPFHFSLANPIPNPFTNQVAISYGIPKSVEVSLKIYNCLGQVVKTLADGVVEPGIYKAMWNGTDNLNRKVSAGIYFYRFTSDEYTSTKKMVMVR